MNVKVWNDEDEQELIVLYRDQHKDVVEIAEYFGKNSRSIVSKLVQLKIYIKPEVNKLEKRSVKSMVIELEDMLGISIDGVNLTKKTNLEALVDAIKLRLSQTARKKEF